MMCRFCHLVLDTCFLFIPWTAAACLHQTRLLPLPSLQFTSLRCRLECAEQLTLQGAFCREQDEAQELYCLTV